MTVVAFPRSRDEDVGNLLLRAVMRSGHVEDNCPRTGRMLESLELEGWDLDLLSVHGAVNEGFEQDDDDDEAA
jgi:hypothetical protein